MPADELRVSLSWVLVYTDKSVHSTEAVERYGDGRCNTDVRLFVFSSVDVGQIAIHDMTLVEATCPSFKPPLVPWDALASSRGLKCAISLSKRSVRFHTALLRILTKS